MVLTLAIAALGLAGCRNPVSPGRELALQRLFTCDGVGNFPTAVREVSARHEMQYREINSPDTYLGAGVLGPSEFAVQVLGGDAKISLFTRRGEAPTAVETRIVDELAAVFSSCRPLETVGP